MAEVLGVVAAATQLAVMAMGLIETVEKIKGATKTLKKYQEQLIEIKRLAESISRNPALQTPDVELHTQSILAKISQTNLEHCLRRSWFSRVYTLILKEKDLIDSFSNIDRQKLSLALVIENIQAHALHQIQLRLEVQTMSTTSRSETPSPTPSVFSETCSPNRRPYNSKSRRNCPTPSSAKTSDQQAPVMPNLLEQDSGSMTEATRLLKNDALEGARDLMKNGPGNFGRSYFVGITGGDGVNMRAGAILESSALGRGPAKHQRDPGDEASKPEPGSGHKQINPGGVDHFVDIRKQGRGNLTVGVQTYSQDGAAGSDEAEKPAHNVVYIDTRHEGVGKFIDADLKDGLAANAATMTVGVVVRADTRQHG